jgi:small GTP-binding protein
MALFNYASKEITLKVVYYGPGLCGKTTNLQHLHKSMTPDKKGKLLSLSTDADRTLFFDFMPIHLGKIKGFNIRFQLYTVPGQVRYNATRKLVLKGADAIVFVADSQSVMKEANIESLQNMRENLISNNLNPEEIPTVLQYNKRDLPSLLSVEELSADLNPKGDQIIESSATEGWGVNETFHLITKRLLQYISRKHKVQIDVPEEIQSIAPVQKKPPKDKVHIALKDKGDTILNGHVRQSQSELEKKLIRSGMAGSPPKEDAQTQWEETQLDTTPFEESTLEAAMPAHKSATSDDVIDWEKAFSQSVFEGTSDQSKLEKMLVEEEKHKTVAPASTAAKAPGSDPSSLLYQLLEEVRVTRKQQELLINYIKRIEKLLQDSSRV